MIRFVTGIATGLAIAYLTAPSSGKITRDSLVSFAKDKVERYKQIKEELNKTVAQVKHLAEVVKSQTGFSLPSLSTNKEAAR
jgi:gas vesicle protein